MKKYLWLLVPLGTCFLLAVYFALTEPREDARTLIGGHQGLAVVWFLIGIIITPMFASVFVIYDLFEWLNRRDERRAFDRNRADE